jgi:type VI secretion system FHA domain protein
MVRRTGCQTGREGKDGKIMLVLRLFHRNSPGRQVEERPFEGGVVTLGRRATSDWPLDDPDRVLSNDHCKFTARGRDFFIVDTSTNGVFMNGRKERLPKGEPVPVRPGDQFALGHYTLMVEADVAERVAETENRDPWDEAPAPRAKSRVTGTPWERDDRGSGGSAKDPFESSLIRDPFAESSIGRNGPTSAGRDRGNPFAAQNSRAVASPKTDIIGDDDAWETTEQKRAGDWNAPKRGPVGMDDSLIGRPRDWVDPEPERTDEKFGFDAPFSMPIMQSPGLTSKSLDIPTDWEEASTLGRNRGRAQPESASNRPPPASRRPERDEEDFPTPRVPPAESRSRPAVRRSAPPEAYGRDDADERDLDDPPPRREESRGRGDGRNDVRGERAPPRPATRAAPRREPDTVEPERREPVPRRTDDQTNGQQLLQAFLDGAKLDPRSVGTIPPEELMRSLGAVYRQMVLGLGDIMSDRTSVKNEFRMAKTVVGRQDNNPFKFLPPQKVAVDLLRSNDEGFMAAEPAVRASFQDVKKHIFCVLAGMRASLAATLGGLDPKEIDVRLKGKSFMTAAGKKAAAWDEFVKFYGQFKKDADDNPESVVNRAFRDAYEKQLQELDGMTGRK